jgi:ATP-dependent Clp protease adaptor protein ClpS
MPDIETKVEKKTKQKITEPSKWKVIMVNDDVTTMQFVMYVLTKIFNHDTESAHELTMDIHNNGSAVVAVYNFDIAETKSMEATALARANDFPLQVKMAKE